jgi:hypothetical protein
MTFVVLLVFALLALAFLGGLLLLHRAISACLRAIEPAPVEIPSASDA